MSSSLITPEEVVQLAFSPTEQITPSAIVESKIVAAEEKYLRPVLGKLLDALKAGKYPDLLADFIKPALAYFVRYGVIPDLSLKLNSMGAQRAFTPHSSAATDRQRSEMRQQAKDDADALLAKALRHISKGNYPEYNPEKNVRKKVILNGGLIITRSTGVNEVADQPGDIESEEKQDARLYLINLTQAYQPVALQVVADLTAARPVILYVRVDDDEPLQTMTSVLDVGQAYLFSSAALDTEAQNGIASLCQKQYAISKATGNIQPLRSKILSSLLTTEVVQDSIEDLDEADGLLPVSQRQAAALRRLIETLDGSTIRADRAQHLTSEQQVQALQNQGVRIMYFGEKELGRVLTQEEFSHISACQALRIKMEYDGMDKFLWRSARTSALLRFCQQTGSESYSIVEVNLSSKRISSLFQAYYKDGSALSFAATQSLAPSQMQTARFNGSMVGYLCLRATLGVEADNWPLTLSSTLAEVQEAFTLFWAAPGRYRWSLSINSAAALNPFVEEAELEPLHRDDGGLELLFTSNKSGLRYAIVLTREEFVITGVRVEYRLTPDERRYVERGATFDPSTGLFALNGVEDLTPAEMAAMFANGEQGDASIVVRDEEHVVGTWIDPKYADRQKLWERTFVLPVATFTRSDGSRAAAEEVVAVTLDPALRLEEEAYLRVVDATLYAAGVYRPLPALVDRIYQAGDALLADLHAPAPEAAGDVRLQLHYVKMQGDVVTFELKVPIFVGGVQPSISLPPLKYFKKVAFTPCFDDSNVTAWCNVFSFINRRRVYTTDRGNGSEDYKYFHKAWKPSATDTFALYPEAFDFDNGTGRRVRYAFSCAIWGGRHDSAAAVNTPLLYKGICWDELRDILDYGGSVLYHDIEETLFDKNDPASIREGFAHLRAQTREKLGVLPKILGQPGGNVAYIDAALGSPLVQFMRQGTPDDHRLIYTNQVYDLYHDHTRGGEAAGQQIAPKIEEIAAQMASDNPYWISFTRHEASRHGDDYQLYKTLYDTYSKNPATDLLWVASWDAVYEWMYLRQHGSVEIDEAAIRTEGEFTYIPCRLVAPRKESFLYRDASLLVDLKGAASSCEVVNCSANVVRAEAAVVGNSVRINLNYNPESIRLAEQYTATFEAKADELDREAALYFVGWLSAELAEPFLRRIEAVRDIAIEALWIAGPALLANGAEGTFTVEALPADNTHMEGIAVSTSGGLSLVSTTRAGNVLTIVCRATAQGAQRIEAVCGALTARHEVTVEAAAASVAIQEITVAGEDAITGTAEKDYTVTCLPADNTCMAQVSIAAEGGLEIIRRVARANVVTVTVRATANGEALLRASAGEISGEKRIAVTGIAAAGRRIVATFGWDNKVAAGGAWDAASGYTRIRPTASTPSGKLYLLDGTEAGSYTYVSADIPKTAGAANRGPATGDNSGRYLDDAIQSFIYAGSANEYRFAFRFEGLQPGRHVVRFYMNTANTAYSRGCVAATYKLTSSEAEYPIAMPADNQDIFYQNFSRTIDTEVVVGADGVLRYEQSTDPAAKYNLAATQILDIEKIG